MLNYILKNRKAMTMRTIIIIMLGLILIIVAWWLSRGATSASSNALNMLFGK